MKSVSAAAASRRVDVVMTVAVGNGGQGKARDVVVTDTFGVGLTFVKALSATQGTYNPATHAVDGRDGRPGDDRRPPGAGHGGQAGQIDSPATVTRHRVRPGQSTLDATAAITGVKPTPGHAGRTSPGPGSGSGRAGPGRRPGPMATTYDRVHRPAQFLLATGFAMNGVKLAGRPDDTRGGRPMPGRGWGWRASRRSPCWAAGAGRW